MYLTEDTWAKGRKMGQRHVAGEIKTERFLKELKVTIRTAFVMLSIGLVLWLLSCSHVAGRH